MMWLDQLEQLNRALFLLINAASQPGPVMMPLAVFAANGLIWLIPAMLVVGWLSGHGAIRRLALEAALAGVLGLLISQVVSLALPHERPFVMGLGQTWIEHAPDNSMPSDHLTLLWSVACSFLLNPSARRLGAALWLAGLPVAWARIYLGVHFPLDMLGALLVSFLSAAICMQQRERAVALVFNLALRVYRLVFSPLIAQHWLRR
ncbi:undecaprenyl-diphosphatase [Silvimonas iriomotensis]|uniref:Undecaprenyl-diphosphatase YbjG n=1 Tax=Silvimonas iriomotensis TaxID=449662 RepID=A0ABQ2PBP2_9NEIS|nr:undecaprenyl-diphosphatase [Silvimonas iriomotensis]GGP22689.1 putative undecaprenyl-diphosphatase YbjG [Silvimonas iriomotensis]